MLHHNIALARSRLSSSSVSLEFGGIFDNIHMPNDINSKLPITNRQKTTDQVDRPKPQCQVERPKRWAMDKRKKTLLVVAAPCRLYDLHTAATLTRPSTRPVRPQSIRKSEQGHLVHRLAGSTIPQERPTNPPTEPQQRQAVVPQPCRIRSSRSSRSRRPVRNSMRH